MYKKEKQNGLHWQSCNPHPGFQYALEIVERLNNNGVSDSIMLIYLHDELNTIR